MSKDKTETQIIVNVEIKDKVKAIAKKNKRTIKGQVEYWADNDRFDDR